MISYLINNIRVFFTFIYVFFQDYTRIIYPFVDSIEEKTNLINLALFLEKLPENFGEDNQEKIEELNQTISNLNNRIEQGAIEQNSSFIAFSRIAKEAKIRYFNIEKIGFSKVLSSSDFIKIDTIPLAIVKWNTTIKDSIINLKELQLRKWMQTEMKLDTLFIKREK